MQYLFGKNGLIYSMNAFCVCLLTCFTVTKAGKKNYSYFPLRASNIK